MRVKATVAYDGGYFQGFQKQKSTNNTITTAIEEVLKSVGIHSEIRGSGRTDAGVHATGQVIDFEIPPYWSDLKRLQMVLNQKLNHIAFKHISFVDDAFHARFSAKKRIYRYLFKSSKPSIFEQNYIAYYPTFDTVLLKKALQCFEGEHDFSHFMKTGTMTHTNVRSVFKSHYKFYHNHHFIYFEANGFLRSQVRMMVEASMQVALGQLSLKELQEQLNLKQRHTTKLAPPQGLYLARILY